MSNTTLSNAETVAGWAFYTRDNRRHAVDRFERSYAELPHPDPARAPHRLPLLNISREGVSFVVPPELLGAAPGSRIDEVVLRLGLLRIEGELTLCHVTRESDGRAVCGGRFRPAGAADRRKLGELIAAIEIPHPR